MCVGLFVFCLLSCDFPDLILGFPPRNIWNGNCEKCDSRERWIIPRLELATSLPFATINFALSSIMASFSHEDNNLLMCLLWRRLLLFVSSLLQHFLDSRKTEMRASNSSVYFLHVELGQAEGQILSADCQILDHGHTGSYILSSQ